MTLCQEAPSPGRGSAGGRSAHQRLRAPGQHTSRLRVAAARALVCCSRLALSGRAAADLTAAPCPRQTLPRCRHLPAAAPASPAQEGAVPSTCPRPPRVVPLVTCARSSLTSRHSHSGNRAWGVEARLWAACGGADRRGRGPRAGGELSLESPGGSVRREPQGRAWAPTEQSRRPGLHGRRGRHWQSRLEETLGGWVGGSQSRGPLRDLGAHFCTWGGVSKPHLARWVCAPCS